MEEMCMAKVLEFPENRSLLRTLEKTVEDLIELHDALSKGFNATAVGRPSRKSRDRV